MIQNNYLPNKINRLILHEININSIMKSREVPEDADCYIGYNLLAQQVLDFLKFAPLPYEIIIIILLGMNGDIE